MNQKNMDIYDKEFLTIKEFADFVGMTTDTLRHYDKKGVFRPAKHGDELESKYRLYSATQVTTIKMIKVLTEIGVPLQTIMELAKDRDPEKLMKLMNKHKDIVADELRFLQGVYSVISTFLDLIIIGMGAIEDELKVSEQPEKRIILGGINNYKGSNSFRREFLRFCNEEYEPKLNLSYPIGGYFESMDEFCSEPSQPTRFFALDPRGNDKKAEGLYLIGYTRGYYGQTNDIADRMIKFAKKNGLIFNGPVYNLFLFDELSIVNPEQYLLQVSASVRETRRVSSRRPARRT